jgi:hypothetical protein
MHPLDVPIEVVQLVSDRFGAVRAPEIRPIAVNLDMLLHFARLHRPVFTTYRV